MQPSAVCESPAHHPQLRMRIMMQQANGRMHARDNPHLGEVQATQRLLFVHNVHVRCWSNCKTSSAMSWPLQVRTWCACCHSTGMRKPTFAPCCCEHRAKTPQTCQHQASTTPAQMQHWLQPAASCSCWAAVGTPKILQPFVRPLTAGGV